MANTSNAKTKVFIGGVSAGTEQTDYEAILTWTEIVDVMDVGDFGDESEAIKYKVLGDGRVRKKRGSTDAGAWEVTVARVADDAGQLAVKAAAASEDAFDFKVETVDGDIFYVTGLVLSAKNEFGDTDQVLQIKFSVELTAQPLEVAAA